MDIQSVIYFMFAAVLLASAIAVVTVPNPVHSALYLIVSFFQRRVFGLCCKQSFSAFC